MKEIALALVILAVLETLLALVLPSILRTRNERREEQRAAGSSKSA